MISWSLGVIIVRHLSNGFVREKAFRNQITYYLAKLLRNKENIGYSIRCGTINRFPCLYHIDSLDLIYISLPIAQLSRKKTTVIIQNRFSTLAVKSKFRSGRETGWKNCIAVYFPNPQRAIVGQSNGMEYDSSRSYAIELSLQPTGHESTIGAANRADIQGLALFSCLGNPSISIPSHKTGYVAAMFAKTES